MNSVTIIFLLLVAISISYLIATFVLGPQPRWQKSVYRISLIVIVVCLIVALFGESLRQRKADLRTLEALNGMLDLSQRSDRVLTLHPAWRFHTSGKMMVVIFVWKQVFFAMRFLERNQECFLHHGIVDEAIWMLAYK